MRMLLRDRGRRPGGDLDQERARPEEADHGLPGTACYNTEDPRATHLRRLSEQLGREAGELKWFEMSRIIERVVNAEKGCHANVDFYSASTYLLDGHRSRALHADLRRVPGLRLDGAHPGAAGSQPPDPPAGQYQGSRQATYVPIDQR